MSIKYNTFKAAAFIIAVITCYSSYYILSSKPWLPHRKIRPMAQAPIELKVFLIANY